MEKCRDYVTFWDFGNDDQPLWKDAFGSLLGAEVEAPGPGAGPTFRWLTGSSGEKSKGMFCCSDGRPERMDILEKAGEEVKTHCRVRAEPKIIPVLIKMCKSFGFSYTS